MIESANTNELQGQYELDDLIPRSGDYQSPQPPDGYDAEGNLLNIDYPPLPKPSPVGEGGTASAVTDEVPATSRPLLTPQ